jgi:hypothetical protein
MTIYKRGGSGPAAKRDPDSRATSLNQNSGVVS